MKEILLTDLRGITLKQLRAFRAVMAAGTVSGAAQELNVTGPAVGLQLKQLEQHAAIPLLERRSTGFTPTEAGLELLDATKRIDLILHETEESLRSHARHYRGQVAIGVVSTAKYFAPRALAAFRRQYPAIDLKLLVGNRTEIVHGLTESQFDFALMGRPPAGVEIEREVFGPHPHVLIVSPGHVLVARERVPIKEVQAFPLLMRERGSGTRALTEQLFADQNLTINAAMEISSNETIKQAVMAGLGIAVISAHTIAAEIRDGRLAIADIEGLPVVRDWSVIKRKDKRLLPAARTLWRFIANEGRVHLPTLG